jgi:hypothetical protein
VRKLTQDKVTKEELEQLIPNEEILQEKMKYLIRDELDTIQNKFTDQLRHFDNKLVKMRSEIDVHNINRNIDKKANEE